jgi:uncharacterized protein YndB with AHSA1/START domain
MKDTDLVITRILSGPRDRVWQAWTEPELVKRWWGPKGFTAPTIQIDLRAGGKYLFCMRGAAGPNGVRDFWSTGIYKEVEAPRKLVMTDSFADEHGNVVPATHYGMEGMPLELLVSVTFAEASGKTKMTLRHAGWAGDENSELARAGWSESFDKLDALLAGGK